MFFNLFKSSEKNNKIGYEDVLYAINNVQKHLLINTLSNDLQSCLITTTMSIDNETYILNQIIEKQQFNDKTIIVYGANSTDDSVDKKYKQLLDLGFINIYIYNGGLFEWLLMQDIYGQENFSTTSSTLDILKYKPRGKLHIPLIGM
jgi:hypothetical protein